MREVELGRVTSEVTPELRGRGGFGNGGASGGAVLQSGQRLLEAHVASGDALDVRHFHAHERMSELFEVAIVALSDNPDIDFEAVAGQDATFIVRSESGERSWTGICVHFEQTAVEERGLSTYKLSIVPKLWLATQRRNHRMFQLMSEIDIVKKLLDEWGIEHEMRLTESYKKRKYRVQYGESDYSFLCRLLEDVGVSFFFEGGNMMVLTDAPQSGAERAPIAFRDNPSRAEKEHVTSVRIHRRVRPGKYTMRDIDYRKPASYPLMASAGNAANVEARLERFHYTPGAFLFESDKGEATPNADDRGKFRTDEGEGKTLAQKRLDAKRGEAKRVTFETNALDPAPGVILSFLDHPKSDLGPDKRLLVLSSDFSGAPNAEWTHECDAVSADAPYRPPLMTPKPKTSGVESATVVGPPGEEIHVDEMGRIRVHFHWDRESKMDDKSSCWIPVSQPWGGAGYGGSNLPRIGQEVIIDFLGGDPDRPVVIGRVYTSLQPTPYRLPENKTQSGLKSNSTTGTGGYNEMMFEDAAGRELLRMQAERDLNKLVKHDEEVKIGRDRAKDVGRDDKFDVGRDRNRTVGRDESAKIGQDRSREVGRDETVDIGQDYARQIGRDLTQNVGQNRDETVGQDLSKNVGRNERESTGQNRTVSVGQNRTTSIGLVDSSTVGEKFFLQIQPPDSGGGEESADAGGGGGSPTSVTMVDKKIVITTGAGATLTMEGAEVRIEADVIKFLAKKNILADAEANDITLHAKTDIALHSDTTIHADTAAGVIDVQATGGNIVLGSNQSIAATGAIDVTVTASSGVAVVNGQSQAALVSATAAVVGAPTAVVAGENTFVSGSAEAELLGAHVLIQGGMVDINP
ncbi:MAG: type VI secretion system tip protein TssI/VgrG [Polyangiaceae bacterium]